MAGTAGGGSRSDSGTHARPGWAGVDAGDVIRDRREDDHWGLGRGGFHVKAGPFQFSPTPCESKGGQTD
jgi:hypothetical protein